MKWLRIGTLLLFGIVLLFAPDPDPEYLFEQDLQTLLSAPVESIGSLKTLRLEITSSGPFEKNQIAAAREAMGKLLPNTDLEGDRDAPILKIVLFSDAERSSLQWSFQEGIEEEISRKKTTWIALLPPFLAILIALLFQRTILALALGVWLGATIVSNWNPLAGIWVFLRTYIIQQAIFDSFRIEIIGFVIGLVALVGIMSKGGGVQGMMQLITRIVKTGRSAQVATYLMGLVIFFDDYANTILVGNTMRPLTDKLKIAREKLAYIVDSTAAPVAGLSLLSTWIAYEVSQFAPQLLEVGIEENPYIIFARTIPYRFYSIFTLIFILAGILMRREFGPMLTAQRRARKGLLSRPGARPMVSDAMTRVTPKEGIPNRWWNGLVPLVTVVVVTMIVLWRSGNAALDNPYGLGGLFSINALRDVIAGAASTRAIATGAWTGFALGAVMMLSQRILTPGEIVRAAFNSTRALFFAIVILLLAWCIGGVCSDLGTAHYLVALFRETLSPVIYPFILFTLSCLVSFSTGSSWSTMAIILPNSVVLAFLLGDASPIGSLGLTVISIGAVLEGSIFGDHCSPLSDTTILSSVSSATDHIDHVRTQIPYAVTTMAVAVLCGYLPAARGLPAPISLAIGTLLLIIILRLIGRNPEESPG